MTDLPSFDPPPQTEPPSPKKPRRKPQRRAVKAAAVVRKRRVPKKRAKRVSSGWTGEKEQHAGGRFTPEVYRLIGTLMALDAPTRNLVIEVAKGLSK